MREIAENLLDEHDSPQLMRAYQDALESHDAPIVIIDIDGIVRYLNRSALGMTKLNSAEDAIGKHVESAGVPWHSSDKSMKDRLMQGESTLYFDYDDRSYVCEAAILHDRLNRRTGFLEYIHTEGSWMQDEDVDPLTGIANKRHFFAETRHLLDCDPNTQYSIVYWGVIRFKLINDVFSPTTGENVLKSIAESIKKIVADGGTCGRIGDDSFAFCLPSEHLSPSQLTGNSEVTLMSDTAMYTFKSTFGVYEIDDLTCSVETMCERAAHAQSSVGDTLAAGGDCYAFYDSAMHKGVLENQELVSQLSYALASDQIKVYFQPIYDIITGQIASAEALARWEHPEKGLVFPGLFIPLFESNGMITELDKHIWDSAAGFLEKRLASGEKVVPVSINVSRVDFFATTLMDEFDDIVSSHDLPRELLRIEVTESAYTDDPKRIIDIVGTLRKRGHTVLLDDFGSGYSSLNTLKDMSIDILKLDMSFLRDFETDDRTKHVINHIVAMAHDLGLKVVAEGVETQEQVDFLRSVDCNLAQGYFYSRPVSEADFVKMLSEEPCTRSS